MQQLGNIVQGYADLYLETSIQRLCVSTLNNLISTSYLADFPRDCRDGSSSCSGRYRRIYNYEVWPKKEKMMEEIIFERR
jgi:hypothetical protein